MSHMIMKKKISRLFATVLFVTGLLSGSQAFAGVGMLEEGENLYISDLSFSAGNKHWDAQRNVIPSICQRRNVSLLQGYEYGYSYFHTVYANITFAHRNCGQDNIRGGGVLLSGRSTGIGDVELGVRTRFNHRDTAAWEVFTIIPTGYDNNSASALGRGALGLGLGVRFSSDDRRSTSSWGWKLGSRFTYFFSGKGNTLRSYAAVQYAFTDSDFEQSGDFLDLRLVHIVGFVRNGAQRQLFFNQPASSLTNSDQTKIQLTYSHSFNNGWSTSFRVGKAIFGRNSPIDWSAGWGLSYRWRD